MQCKSSQPAAASVSTATLLNTYWRLAEMNGEPLTTPDGRREVHIILTQEGNENRLKGFAGCNSVGGTFRQEEQKLTFSAISTKMMCDPESMKVEDFLLGALTETDSYTISGETLSLLEGETALASFQAVYLK